MYKLLRHFQHKIIIVEAGKKPYTHARIYLIYTLCCDETRRIKRWAAKINIFGQQIWIERCFVCARRGHSNYTSIPPPFLHSLFGYPYSINEILLQSQFPCSFSHIRFWNAAASWLSLFYVCEVQDEVRYILSAWQATIIHNIHEYKHT